MTSIAPQRISSAELLERLDTLTHLAYLRYRPAPLLVYKPNDRDNSKGTALKVEYRVWPYFTDQGYLRAAVEENNESEGGMFMDFSAQIGTSAKGYAEFNWKRTEHVGTPQTLITTKIGIADIQALLLGYNCKRIRNIPTPPSIRSVTKGSDGKWGPEAEGNTVGLTHKFADRTSIIEWSFTDRGSFLKIAKLPEQVRRSVPLSLAEELSFVTYLQQGLAVLLEVGLR